MNSHQELASLVMDRIRNAFDFFFQCLVHPAQGGDRILKPAMSHFKGRKNLRQKISSSTFSFGGALWVRKAAHDFEKRFLMEHCHFNNTGSLAQRFASKFVGLA